MPGEKLLHTLFPDPNFRNFKGPNQIIFTSPPIFDPGFVAHLDFLAGLLKTKYKKDARLTGNLFYVVMYGPISILENRVMIACTNKPSKAGDVYNFRFADMKFDSSLPDEILADQIVGEMAEMQKSVDDSLKAPPPPVEQPTAGESPPDLP